MDQFSAHLDRGWDLAQRGDTQGAEVSARRALELDAQSPEAHNLLGYVAALQGEFDDAVEQYAQAIALDDTYLEAMLNAAEVFIHPLGEYDEAIKMCDHALELAENDDEIVDALLLKFDALLGKNDSAGARVLCERFPSGPFENPNHGLLVGRAFYEIGDLDRAQPLVEEATRLATDSSEAWYYLGLVLDEREQVLAATRAFLRSRDLDLEAPPPPWSLNPETFADTAQRVVDGLAEQLRTFIRTDEIYIADVPGAEVVADGVDPRAMLLLDGFSAEEDGSAPTARLFVYQRNVERLAGAMEAVEAELRMALEREIIGTFVEPDHEHNPQGPLN
ncbi:MAG: tetratricopeptide repeat protein [Polyangiaceae bacterium]|nr:tetratricopeptide repeat protein [Polyangiaceae bacterium]